MNFRVYASGLVLILAYQIAIAAAVIWFVVHCEAAGASAREAEAPGMAAEASG